MSDTPQDPSLVRFLQQTVVLDTPGPMIYIGILEAITAHYLELREADVHDSNDSRATKELYIAETRDLGVRANRACVLVARHSVISLSLLSDVKE